MIPSNPMSKLGDIETLGTQEPNAQCWTAISQSLISLLDTKFQQQIFEILDQFKPQDKCLVQHASIILYLHVYNEHMYKMHWYISPFLSFLLLSRPKSHQ